MADPLVAARMGIEPFAMTPEKLRRYLADLNGLPLHDNWIQFWISADFVDENRDRFSEKQLDAIDRFRRVIETLPPEEDDFWADDALDDEKWHLVREEAAIALQALA